MATALRSRVRLSSITSRNGSQKLVDRARCGSFGLESLNPTHNTVVTSFSLAGFAVSAFAFPFVERFSVLVLGLGLVLAGFVASDPVVTWVSLAGFAGGLPAHTRAARTPLPARFRYAAAVLPTPPGPSAQTHTAPHARTL